MHSHICLVSVFCLIRAPLMFWAYSYIPVLALCYAYYFHSSLLMNAIFGSTSLLYGSCIQLSYRTDRTNRQPSWVLWTWGRLWDAIFGPTAPFSGSSFFVDPYGLYYGFFGSCQLERTRNIHVCLLYCATRFPVVNECNFRVDKSIIRIALKIFQSYGSNESTNLLPTLCR